MEFEQAHNKTVLWVDWNDHIGKIEQYAIVGSVYVTKDGKGKNKPVRDHV